MTDVNSFYDLHGIVAKVIDDYKLVINRGSDHGLKAGIRYMIYGIGEDIKDPETGESLGAIELVRGTGKVTHVQQKIATIETDMKGAPSRTVRYRDQGYGIMSTIYGKEKIEEQGEPIIIPFESPQAGDKAKPI